MMNLLTWLGKLPSFTSWDVSGAKANSRLRSPDGQCLMLSSRDGYCTIVVFDQPIPAHHTQQFTLQLQSIAHSHHMPSSHHGSNPSTSSLPAFDRERSSPVVTPAQTPSRRPVALPTPTPTSSHFERDGSNVSDLPGPAVTPSGPPGSGSASAPDSASERAQTPSENREPPKKKRRIALTHHGDAAS